MKDQARRRGARARAAAGHENRKLDRLFADPRFPAHAEWLRDRRNARADFKRAVAARDVDAALDALGRWLTLGDNEPPRPDANG